MVGLWCFLFVWVLLLVCLVVEVLWCLLLVCVVFFVWLWFCLFVGEVLLVCRIVVFSIRLSINIVVIVMVVFFLFGFIIMGNFWIIEKGKGW